MSHLQSLRGRGVQPGVATQVFSRMKRRVRGRGPGKRVEAVGVAHTGSTALTPGGGAGGKNDFNEFVLGQFTQVRFTHLVYHCFLTV